jgi:glucose/mannose-6-phosphate isomerase
MNLNKPDSFLQLDPQGMIAEIDSLPAQLEAAWKLGLSQPKPFDAQIRQVLVAGVGGSAIGADLLAAYVGPRCRAPVIIHRDYGLPAWACGPDTLVIASSHSGNTEETLSTFEQGQARGCRCLVITTGGKLAQAARQSSIPLWTFVHSGAPRSAVGFSFGLLLAALIQTDLLPDRDRVTADVNETVIAMRRQQLEIQANVPVAQNFAKRLARHLVGHLASILGAGVLAPVARRWKGQFNELAKAWATFDALPEANHNTLAGMLNPVRLLPQAMMLFLSAPSDLPRNRLRAELMHDSLLQQGLKAELITAQGESSLAHQWTSLHLGDYVSYYLAMAYGIDPTPILAIDALKNRVQSLPFKGT